MAETSFFHIAYRPPVTWHYEIYNRLNRTHNETLKSRSARGESTDLPELALALATKLTVLHRVIRRFNSDYERLLAAIRQNEDQIRKHIRSHTVWSPPDDLLPFDIIAGLDWLFCSSPGHKFKSSACR